MRTTFIQLGGQYYEMRELSCEQVIVSLGRCEAMQQADWPFDLDKELLRAMCENAVLGFESIYTGEKKRFASPDEVLKTLSLSEPANIFDTYSTAFSKDGSGQTIFEAAEVEE